MPRQISKAEYARIVKWGWDVTDNGVYFNWELSGPDGAWFELIREPRHTDADIAEAKRQLRRDRDVTGFGLATYDPATAPEDY